MSLSSSAKLTDAPPVDVLKNLMIFILVLAIIAVIIALMWNYAVKVSDKYALIPCIFSRDCLRDARICLSPAPNLFIRAREFYIRHDRGRHSRGMGPALSQAG